MTPEGVGCFLEVGLIQSIDCVGHLSHLGLWHDFIRIEQLTPLCLTSKGFAASTGAVIVGQPPGQVAHL
jgi:hypothetical protein